MGLIRDIWCETDIRWLFVRQCCPVFISTSGSSFAFSKHEKNHTLLKKTLSLSHTHRYCGHYISSHRAVANSQRGPALESHIYMQPSSTLALSLLVSLSLERGVPHPLNSHIPECLLPSDASVWLNIHNVIQGSWEPLDMRFQKAQETGFAQIQAPQEEPKATILL